MGVPELRVPRYYRLMDGIIRILIPLCFPLCSGLVHVPVRTFFRNHVILHLCQGSCDILVSERCRGCWLRHGHWGARRPTKGGSDVALETLRGRSWSFRFGCGPRCWHLRCYIAGAIHGGFAILLTDLIASSGCDWFGWFHHFFSAAIHAVIIIHSSRRTGPHYQGHNGFDDCSSWSIFVQIWDASNVERDDATTAHGKTTWQCCGCDHGFQDACQADTCQVDILQENIG